jgi:hypothetical protein
MEWPRTLWSRRQMEHLDARDLLPPLPKIVAEHRRGSLTPRRRARRTTARFTLPPTRKGPLRRNSQRPRSPASASERDRRPPPANEIAELRHQHRETLTREGIWDRDGEKRKRKWRRKRRGSASPNRQQKTTKTSGDGPGFRCETVRVQVGSGRRSRVKSVRQQRIQRLTSECSV